jgi:hypothetical protein
MCTLHQLLARGFALALDPLARFQPVVGLTLISAVSGVVLLIAFRLTSRPQAIRAAKQKTQAHLLAVRLYRDDLVVVLRAQGALLGALVVYIGAMLVPFLALLVPFGLLFAHLDARYAVRALHPGERAIVKATAVPDTRLDRWRLEGAAGVVVDSAPVRVSARREINWRVRAATPGRYAIAVVNGERRIEKEVQVAAEEIGGAPRRASAGIAALFIAPTEAPIDPDAGIESIEVVARPLRLSVYGWHVHWIVIFLVVSAATALLLRKRAGVEF